MHSKIAIYQVLPRLFGNSNDTNKPHGTKMENGCGTFEAFGAKALTEIRKMGFSHIWYTGVLQHATCTDYADIQSPADPPSIVKGQAGSPYAIKDYYDVAPDLASNPHKRMQEFEALIERTHQANLKVIIDFVPNHVARTYCSKAKPLGVRDLGEDDNQSMTFSSQNNFYYLPGETLGGEFLNNDFFEHPAKVTGNDCFSATPGINDWYETIKLNYGVDYLNGRQTHFHPMPNTWLKMKDILLFWASKGIDGFRCDMAEMVPVEFWQWAIAEVKKQYPHLIFVAEVYNPAEYGNYIHIGGFDYLYDKVGLYDTLRNIVQGHQPTSDITFCWQRLGDLQKQMLNFLENHDEQRIASHFFAGDPQKAKPAMLVSALMNTNPVMIYFGQELGESGMYQEGFSGTDGRTSIFDYWHLHSIERWRNGNRFGEKLLTDTERSLRHFYINVLHICKNEASIAQGSFFDLMYANYDNPDFDSTRQFAFLRNSEGETMLVVANFANYSANIRLHIPPEALHFVDMQMADFTSAHELLTGKTEQMVFASPNDIALHVEAYGGKVLKFVRQ